MSYRLVTEQRKDSRQDQSNSERRRVEGPIHRDHAHRGCKRQRRCREVRSGRPQSAQVVTTSIGLEGERYLLRSTAAIERPAGLLP